MVQGWPDPMGQENGLFTIDYCIQLPSPSNGHNDLSNCRGRPAVLVMPGILHQKPDSPNLGLVHATLCSAMATVRLEPGLLTMEKIGI